MADYRLTQSLPPLPGSDDASSTLAARGDTGKMGRGPVQDRSCYSFCMCPGGQVVPTSVDPKEVGIVLDPRKIP